MQRLISLKLTCKSPKILSFQSVCSQSVFLPLSKSNPFHRQPPLPLQTRHFSTRCTAPTHSWRSPNAISGRFSDAVSPKPIFGRRVSPSAPFKAPGKGLVCDGEVGFLGAQFSRRGFRSNPSFEFHNQGWQSWLRRRLTTDGVVLGLIVANVAVYMLWQIADRDFMGNHFMISLDNVISGRVHTLITSAFSQRETGHLIFNMIGLYFFGTSIGRSFGPEFLLKLYLAGAFVGSVFFLAHRAFLASSKKRNRRIWGIDESRIPGLGSSGAVNAIMLLDIFLNPKKTVYVEFILPIPAILLGIFIIGKDLLGILQGDTEVSGAAHLGGVAAAAVAWARVRKGRF